MKGIDKNGIFVAGKVRKMVIHDNGLQVTPGAGVRRSVYQGQPLLAAPQFHFSAPQPQTQ